MRHHPLMSALLIALLISSACTYMLSRKVVIRAPAPRVPDKRYVTPSRPLQAGEMLKADNLEMVSWPASNALTGAYARPADIEGRIVLYPLEKGQPVLERELAAPGSAVGLSGKIPAGMRAIALRSDEVVGVAGFLVPGSHLDVLVSYHTDKLPEPITATVLQDAVVLAAGQQIEPDPTGKATAVTVVTLLLTPEESERAFLASNQGTIHFVLRNGADQDRSTIDPVYLSQLSDATAPPPIEAKPVVRVEPPPPPRPAKEMEIETVLGDGKPAPKPEGGELTVIWPSKHPGMPTTLYAFAMLCGALPAGSQVAMVSGPRQAATLQQGAPANALLKSGAVAPAALAQLPLNNESLHIAVGGSMVLTSPTPLRRIYVGNPAVLQTFTSGLTEIVLTPKIVGSSSLIVWDQAGGRRQYTVCGDFDPQSLRSSLREAFPSAAITAEAHDGKIYLAGTVPTDGVADAAFKLAQLFGKDVVNSIRVVAPRAKQVELKLRIVEVDRTKLDQFGINIFAGGSNAIGTSTQQYSTGQSGVGSSAFAATDPLNLLFYNFSNAIGASVKDLQQRDILQVLAEPTLVTISGLPARFLSGGEFPVPVVQGGIGTTAAVTIIFRPYGVKVDFTPTVNEDGSIRLKISPEVSTLDYSNAVTISGFTIPALSTRRAETEVQIRDGQTFMVSGLLDHRTTENLSKVPGIANVPILGELFKSKSIDHSVVELVLIVTARVVDPLTSTDLPAEPKMATPIMQSKTFDAQAKGAANAKQAGAVAPGADKP